MKDDPYWRGQIPPGTLIARYLGKPIEHFTHAELIDAIINQQTQIDGLTSQRTKLAELVGSQDLKIKNLERQLDRREIELRIALEGILVLRGMVPLEQSD